MIVEHIRDALATHDAPIAACADAAGQRGLRKSANLEGFFAAIEPFVVTAMRHSEPAGLASA